MRVILVAGRGLQKWGRCAGVTEEVSARVWVCEVVEESRVWSRGGGFPFRLVWVSVEGWSEILGAGRGVVVWRVERKSCFDRVALKKMVRWPCSARIGYLGS